MKPRSWAPPWRFYSILSMGPLLLLVISISGMVLGQEAASGAIVNEMRGRSSGTIPVLNQFVHAIDPA